MSSLFSLVGIVGFALAGPSDSLRVCADPNNLPFSNAQEQGFENKIARLIAADLGVPLRYRWWPERRGFIRHTLKAKICDVVMGVPVEYERTMPTAPYYRSTYVFVSRVDRHLAVASFDDPSLARLRIGVHFMGDDYANSPAAVALARRGLGARIVPFMIYGDYSKPDPPAELVQAVARGTVDLAVVWGPLAGWVASRSRVPLRLTPIVGTRADSALGLSFAIAMGVRPGDRARRAMLDAELVRRRAAIDHILDQYGVPRVDRRPKAKQPS